jgi:hypothetical protein
MNDCLRERLFIAGLWLMVVFDVSDLSYPTLWIVFDDWLVVTTDLRLGGLCLFSAMYEGIDKQKQLSGTGNWEPGMDLQRRRDFFF